MDKQRVKHLERKLAIAIKTKDWWSLIAYPQVLLHWQLHYPDDAKKAAQFSSHKLGMMKIAGELAVKNDEVLLPEQLNRKYHVWCGSEEECKIYDQIVRFTLGQQILAAVKRRYEAGQTHIAV